MKRNTKVFVSGDWEANKGKGEFKTDSLFSPGLNYNGINTNNHSCSNLNEKLMNLKKSGVKFSGVYSPTI
jgi:hypothetical protein